MKTSYRIIGRSMASCSAFIGLMHSAAALLALRIKKSTDRGIHLAGWIAVTGLSASATAQISGSYSGTSSFDIDFKNCPDFDQERSAGYHPEGEYVDGLANGGDYYCMPASSGNLLAYLALHEVETLFPTGYYWGDDDALTYGKVTQAIKTLGERMLIIHTPVFGIGGAAGCLPPMQVIGLRKSLPSDDFDVSGHCAPKNHPTVPEMARWASEGGLMSFCFGRYSPDEDKIGLALRNSGHSMTFAGAKRKTASGQQIWYHNPGTGGDSEQSQSDFTKPDSDWQNSEWTYRLGLRRITREYSEIWKDKDKYTELIDFVCLITPEDTTVSFENPHLAGTARVPNNPQVRATCTESSGVLDDITNENAIDYAGHFDARKIIEVAYTPSMIDTFAVLLDSNGQHRLVWADYASGNAIQIGASVDARMTFTTSRFGELYTMVGDELRYYDLPSRPLTAFPPPAAPHRAISVPGVLDIAYHDATDRLILLIGGPQPTIRAVASDLSSESLTLPTQVAGYTMSGPMEIATSPVSDALWILSHHENKLARVDVASISWGFPVVPNLMHSLTGEIRNLQIDEQGDVFFRQDNLVRHYVEDQNAGLLPRVDSPRWGLVSQGGFAVTVARDPFIDGLHDQPQWLNIPVVDSSGIKITFADWAAGVFTPLEIASGAADPMSDSDGDGRNTLMEYYFGRNPTAPDSDGDVKLVRDETSGMLRIAWRQAAEADVNLKLVMSTTLAEGSWEDVPPAAVSLNEAFDFSGADRLERTAKINPNFLPPAQRRFFRLEVSVGP